LPTLGERIKEERKKLDLTQEELGKKCGVTKYTISLYESNKSTPSDDIKKIMADYFCVTMDYLMGISNERGGNSSKHPITPKDKTNELKNYLIRVGYMKSYDDLDENQIDFIKDTIERYLKTTNNYKGQGED
jgi:transcriptional regulator with XRE-family HTH domain